MPAALTRTCLLAPENQRCFPTLSFSPAFLLTPQWLVTRGCPGWSHLITWSSSKCPSPQTSHITPSLTHSLSRLTQETKPKICLIWVCFPHKGVDPLAYQRATGSISVSFVGWPDCPFSLASMPVCLTETSLDFMKKPKRELDIGELKWQTQKGWNMTPTIVGFCPWLASVMGLYGLTVTMRIHQLLTIRKISNHLNHLLIIFSSGRILEQK